MRRLTAWTLRGLTPALALLVACTSDTPVARRIPPPPPPPPPLPDHVGQWSTKAGAPIVRLTPCTKPDPQRHDETRRRRLRSIVTGRHLSKSH